MIKKRSSTILRNNLKKCIDSMKMSPRQLAIKMKRSPAAVSRWLAGERDVSLEILDELSDVLDIKASDLINPKLKIKVEVKRIITIS